MANQKLNSLQLGTGSILAVAENTGTLTWSGTTKTIWDSTTGTWGQYGLIAASTNKHAIQITVPTGKKWTIKLSHLASTVSSPNTHWSHSGIAKVTGAGLTTVSTFLTSSLNANGDNYHPQSSECVQVLTAGTYAFASWVRTTDTVSSTVWYGGGDTTDSGATFAFGRSMVITATMIKVEDV